MHLILCSVFVINTIFLIVCSFLVANKFHHQNDFVIDLHMKGFM